MTPTPETDAFILRGIQTGYNWRKFARKLERERDEAHKRLAVLQELLNDIEDPLQLIAEYWNGDETLESMTPACWYAVGTAKEALKKIKPHLT